MEIGCGARVRDFDGRRYFYFWHYERTNGRSARHEDYVGRVGSGEAGAAPSDRGLPSPGRARIRATPGQNRAGHRIRDRGRAAYRHLEVCSRGHARHAAYSMYRSASAGGRRDARMAGCAVHATVATDAPPMIASRCAHGTLKTMMSAKYTT